MGEEQEAPKTDPGVPGAAGDQPAPEDPVQAEISALREKAARADEYLDLARRAKADFINYQDRVRRDRQLWTRQAVEDFIRDFIPAIDSFALARFEDPKLMEAIRLIEKEFLRVLAKNGIKPIETEGKTFDPAFHEAVAVLETTEKPDGAILDEARRGWTIDGHVLRAASVRVAKAPPK